MEFDADLELTAEELAHLFEMILEGLRAENKFELPIENTKFELNIGSAKVQSSINIANISGINRLILGFQWKEPITKTTATKKVTEKPAKEVAVDSEETVQVFEDEHVVTTAEEVFTTDEPIERTIPQRMILQTTTFGNDVGYYISAFSPEEESIWERVSDPEQGLAHEKWNTQIQHEGIPTIGEFKHKKESEDLFEELEKKPIKKPIKNTTTQKKSYITKSTTTRTAVAPPPAAKAKKAPLAEEEEEWQEPSRDEIATDDDWVKPSEIIKQTQGGEVASFETEKEIVTEKGLKPSQIAELTEDKSAQPPQPPRPKKPASAPKRPDAKQESKSKKKGWASWDQGT